MRDTLSATTLTRRPGVFLSHSQADRSFARRLGNDLVRAGIRIWIDEAEIKVADSLIRKIREGIDAMEYLAVILSKTSVASEWVQREVDIAMNQEISGRRVKVLPILLQDCALPGFLEGKVYADFRDPERYEESLQRILDRILGTGRPVVPPLSKKDAARALLRAALLDWSYYQLLPDRGRLKLLADAEVNLVPDEVDLVTKSLIEALAPLMLRIDEYYDKNEFGEDYTEAWPEIETFARLLMWAASHGARHRIAEVYRWIKQDSLLTAPYLIRDLGRLTGIDEATAEQWAG